MNIKRTTNLFVIAVLSLAAISCKNSAEKDNAAEPMSSEMHQQETGKNETTLKEQENEIGVISDYLEIKNALVNDDQETAAKAGERLAKSLGEFKKDDYSSEEQQELNDIIEDAKEHAEHISKSPIAHQREHFDILSKDMIDMIAITGTDRKLYQAYCPMYNENKGAQWLSTEQEIKNPYMGAKMMNCGKVQKELN